MQLAATNTSMIVREKFKSAKEPEKSAISHIHSNL